MALAGTQVRRKKVQGKMPGRLMNAMCQLMQGTTQEDSYTGCVCTCVCVRAEDMVVYTAITTLFCYMCDM